MTENALHFQEADARREIDRLLEEMKRMQAQNEINAARIERARARTARNLTLAEEQLDALARR